MIMQTYFELLKIIKRKSIWAIFIVFLILNCIQINSTKVYSMSSDWNEGYHTVYETVKGEITKDKLEFVISNYQKNANLVNEGKYDPNKIDKDTYTKHIFGDMNLFKEFYDKLDYAYHYVNKIENITTKAKENITFLINEEDKGNEKQLIQAYEGRLITSYYETDGFTAMFSYDFSLLLSIVLLLFILASIHTNEKETDMILLMRTAKKGRDTSVYSKFMAALILVVLISFIFLVFDSVMFSQMYPMEGWSNPLYSIPMFCYSPLNITILGYFFFTFFIRCLVLTLVSFIIVLISQLSKSTLISFFVSLCVVSFIVLNQNNNKLIDNLLLPRNLIKEYTVIRIGDFQVMEYLIAPVVVILLSLGIVCFSIIWMKKSYNIVKRKNRHV